MVSKVFHKYFIVFLLLIIIYLLFKNNNNNLTETFNNYKPKVAILIISANSKRWNTEKIIWKKYADKFPNIKCFFIECDNIENFETLSSNCNENYIPGIYQKSLNSLKEIGDGFDFYIRGNLSTFYIFEYLNKYLQNIPQNIPIHTGGQIFRRPSKVFVGGTSIVLNKLARTELIKYGFEKKYYENTSIPDDVLISKVLLEHNIKVSEYTKTDNLYVWNYNKSYDFNLKNVNKNKSPFLRLKTQKIKKYKEISDKLYREYYS